MSKSKKFQSAREAVAGKNQKPVNSANKEAAEAAIPDGYEEQSADIAGFWIQEGPAIHFVPTECRMMDSSIDKTKTSTLVIGRLVDAVDLTTSDKVIFRGEPGDVVGVWAKPGMTALATLAGIPVYMYLDSFKDTGKASPMARFAVLSKGRGAQLPVTRDTRVASRSAKDALGIYQPKATKES